MPLRGEASEASLEDLNVGSVQWVRSAWLAEEDELILSQVEEVGPRWRIIAAMVPGRSDDAVRNRWKRLKLNRFVPADQRRLAFKRTGAVAPSAPSAASPRSITSARSRTRSALPLCVACRGLRWCK